jgi:hypothetical protein
MMIMIMMLTVTVMHDSDGGYCGNDSSNTSPVTVVVSVLAIQRLTCQSSKVFLTQHHAAVVLAVDRKFGSGTCGVRLSLA